MDISSLINMNFPKFSFRSTSGVEVAIRNRLEWLEIYIYPTCFPQTHVHDVLDWLENTNKEMIEENT